MLQPNPHAAAVKVALPFLWAGLAAVLGVQSAAGYEEGRPLPTSW